MKFRLNSLVLSLRKGDETILFKDFNYFWGQMGAGKTSIARLIDFCLGGDVELTPAMQSEFVGARLNLELEHASLALDRSRDADQVIAEWKSGDDAYQVVLPARNASGEVIPGSGVENLSDLLFMLSGKQAPRVRKSKIKQNSENVRLSMRDLLWYCYLDQDDLDSSFFHLEEGANPFVQFKSRDVLRFVIGFHDEHVSELEAALDQARGERLTLLSTIDGVARTLKELGVDSEAEILGQIDALNKRISAIETEIASLHDATNATREVHAGDNLRARARELGDEIARLDAAIEDVHRIEDRDRRHLHEIETLSLKFRRSVSAKAVLGGVLFESCPRCAQSLPERDPGSCRVCGQTESVEAVDATEGVRIERDAKARRVELTDMLARREAAVGKLRREREARAAQKVRIERERNEALASYDSAYLSNVLVKERERAAIQQEIENLSGLTKLPRMLGGYREQVARIETKERQLREQLREARKAAESDTENLDRLRQFFLDCLVRAGVPGIADSDRVEIPTTNFFPRVYGPELADEIVTSFATISSGGKKTLFKCCFAIAVHRLAVKVGAPLPEILIIDSPMKNISERENRQQFEGFYSMLYELKSGELSSTQMVLIDKEYSPPEESLNVRPFVRHMRPGDPENPPLIPYYVGK